MKPNARLPRALLLVSALGTPACQPAPAVSHDEASAVSAAPAPDTCRVRRVVDGDTLTCEDGRRIRLIGIDAPESDQEPFGDAARAALERLAPRGEQLAVTVDVVTADRYGRTLAYLETPAGVLINEAMVRRGFAVPLTIPPNVAHAPTIQSAAQSARTAGAGLWSSGGFDCAPSAHRSGRC